jgi:hypothetical protein
MTKTNTQDSVSFANSNVPIPWLAIVALMGTILPFIVLAHFVHPVGEDYAESVKSGVWSQIKDLYLTWDGRFFTSFLFAVNPLKNGSLLGYRMLPLLFMVGQYWAGYLIIRMAIRNFPGVAAWAHLWALALLNVSIGNIPSLSYGYYYMSASFVYTVPLVSLGFLIVSSLRMVYADKEVSVSLWLISSVFFIIPAVGCSEQYLPLLCAWILVLWILNAISEQGRALELTVLTGTLFTAIFIVFTSPGLHTYLGFGPNTSERDLNFYGESLSQCVSDSSVQLFRYTLQNPAFYALFALMAYFIGSFREYFLVRFPGIRFRYVIGAASLTVSAALLASYPYYWGNAVTVSSDNAAVLSLGFHLTVWGTVSTFLLFWLWYFKQHKSRPRFLKSRAYHGLIVQTILIAAVLVSPNFRLAMSDLLSGQAAGYDVELAERTRLLSEHVYNSGDERTVTVCELNHRPTSIFGGVDINVNSSHWVDAYKTYYEVSNIKVSKCR